MKYLAKSQNGKMIQLGEDIKKGKWFYVTEATKQTAETLTIGEDITFTSEPRGGAFYVTFLAKGNVQPPIVQPSKTETVQTPQPKTTPSLTSTKPVTSYTKPVYNKTDMSKEDWADKEIRDYKGRCIVYASSILKDAGINCSQEEYYTMLFNIANKLREYIYSK